MNPLIGFRAWRFELDSSLRSTMYWWFAWTVGDQTIARCPRYFGVDPTRGPHPPPGRDCRCGLYARTEPAGVLEEYPLYPRSHAMVRKSEGDMCIGAVVMSGEVAWGDRVIRASHARPLCLCEPGTNAGPERRAKLEAIARHNRIPLVPWAHVVGYASEFGDPAPSLTRSRRRGGTRSEASRDATR